MTQEWGALVLALRQALKARKVTYAAVADGLGLSEQTVKRLMRGDSDCTVERLVAICKFAGVEFFDLMRLASEPKYLAFELTLEQEEFLVANPSHHAFLSCVRNRMSLADIVKADGVSLASARRYLRDLEKLGVLERTTGDGYRMLVEGAHNLLKNGPLTRTISKRSRDRLFEHIATWEGEGEAMLTHSDSRIALTTARELVLEVKELAARYRARAQRERTLLPDHDLVTAEWCFAVAAPIARIDFGKITEL